MDSRNAVIIISGILVAVFALVSWAWGGVRGASLLDGWARSQGLEILSQEECWFFKGPFFWTSSKGQKIYRVTVRDGEGTTRSGYVRCGGYWMGMLSDNVDVRWDS